MNGGGYVPGAIIAAHALKTLRTKHDVVCMVTEDVKESFRVKLRCVFDAVVEVPYLEQSAGFVMSSKKQAALYGAWESRSYTKWNCLSLTNYDRVILMDADVMAISNCDDLFDLSAPAACYSNPWAYPYVKCGGVYNPYVATNSPATTSSPAATSTSSPAAADLIHGTKIPSSAIVDAVNKKSFVGWGALVLLEPTNSDYAGLIAWLQTVADGGKRYDTVSGVDEVSIAMYYATKTLKSWTHIHQRYIAIPWKLGWVRCDIRARHYHGRKPWDMDVDEWPDLKSWWLVADQVVRKYPELGTLLNPSSADETELDVALTQLQTTFDLRTLIVNHRRPPVDWDVAGRVLSRWFISIENGGPSGELARQLLGSKAAKTAATAERLAADLVLFKSKRSKRMSRPLGLEFNIRDGRLTCGSHFTVAVTSRLGCIINDVGIDAAGLVSIKHATTLGSQDLHKPQFIQLMTFCEIYNEAFTSPMNTMFYGMTDRTYHTLHPKVDAVFGSAGDLFAAVTRDGWVARGGWYVEPPLISKIESETARIFAGGMNHVNSCTIIFLLRADCEACDLLRKCEHFVAEKPLEGKKRVYIILSSQPTIMFDVSYILSELSE